MFKFQKAGWGGLLFKGTLRIEQQLNKLQLGDLCLKYHIIFITIVILPFKTMYFSRCCLLNTSNNPTDSSNEIYQTLYQSVNWEDTKAKKIEIDDSFPHDVYSEKVRYVNKKTDNRIRVTPRTYIKYYGENQLSHEGQKVPQESTSELVVNVKGGKNTSSKTSIYAKYRS